MPFNLQANKINVGDTDYPTKHNAAVDAMEQLGNDLEQQTTDTKNWTSGEVAKAAASATLAQSEQGIATQAKIEALQALADAIAVVTGGTASNLPGAGLIPLADAIGKIHGDWLDWVIPAISAQYAGLNIKATCLYNTANDSDGGAWIHKTASLSYGQEAVPSGRYVGGFIDTNAAVSGGAGVGDWFYNVNTGLFVEVTGVSPNTSVEIFRAGSKTFPAQVVIAAEADRVIIFDASGSKLTMWGVYKQDPSTRSLTSLASINGKIFIGIAGTSATDSEGGVRVLDFASDRLARYTTYATYTGTTPDGLANYHETDGVSGDGNGSALIVNAIVNAVAAAVLDSSPLDNATGLKIPTIAVGTDGGVSVITHDGDVWDVTSSSGASFSKVSDVSFDDAIGLVFGMYNDSNAGSRPVYGIPIPTADRTVDGNEVNATDKLATNANSIGNGLPINLGDYAKTLSIGRGEFACYSASGLSIHKANPSDIAKGMVAHITDKFNTGYMVGDTKLAVACENELGSIVETELVTNGTFLTDSDWTKGAGWTISGGVATQAGAGTDPLYQDLGLGIGKFYVVTFEITSITAGAVTAYCGGSGVGTARSAVGTYTEVIACAGNSTFYMQQDASFEGSIDNVSVTEVGNIDRSGNSNHLKINGTVALNTPAGGDVALLSGWSSANYLSQPYNSDLDFGAGDFVYAGWFKTSDAFATQIMIYRASATSAAGDIRIQTTPDKVSFLYHNGTSWQWTLTSTRASLNDGSLHQFVILRSGGTLYMYIDGVLDNSVAFTDTLTDTSAILRVGNSSDGSFGGDLALLRAGATAPTADQIKKMYREEKAMLEGKATLDGSDPDIKALAYDKERDLLRVASQGVISTFKGLERVATSLAGAANLVTNGTFDSSVSGWDNWSNPTNPGSASQSGGYGILGDGVITAPVDAVQDVAVTPGKSYKITFTGYTENCVATFYMSDGANYSYAFGNFALSDEEKTYTKTVTPTQSVIRLYPYKNSGSGKAYFDNIKIEEVSSAAPFQSIGAANGALLLTGANGVDFDLPAANIRERVAKAFYDKTGSREDFEFTGDGSATDFALPAGWKPKRSYIDGSKKREGNAEDYTVKYDGFAYSVSFAVAPALNAEIDVEAIAA